MGGAHREPERAIDVVGDYIEKALHELGAQEGSVIKMRRRQKFLEMGHAV